MDRPPEFLDGVRVVQFASLEQAQPTGKTRHVVNGLEVSGFAAVAVAQCDEDASGVYLFYCDESWNVVTDTPGTKTYSRPSSRPTLSSACFPLRRSQAPSSSKDA